MSRARAVALCLVNWKGVFFERYQLDRHVTALEGGNGAGKTTVMVAAYVVLLPDLQRLKFVNVGESGATGGDRGIWGRLGDEGPSYSALEVELAPGQRVLCGVLLERKAAPSLSLQPFLISPLSDSLTAHELLLATRDGHDEIPTLSEVSKQAAARGASCEVFGSAREYFSRLFELGIGALRLSTDEERNKFNDMLRTSMTGGISRTLTNDLRSFLFKRESGLFDTLSRMRQNLDACRRTRLEVGEARALEHEIGGIYAAGHAMFVAALGASRQRAREARAELQRVEQASTALRQRVLELETVASELSLRKGSLAPRLERALAAEEVARERLSRLGRAHELEQRVLAAGNARAQLAEPAELALERKRELTAARESSKAARDAAQSTLLRAAAGVASLQAGLEELHRQSHAFGRVRQLLGQAQRLLGDVLAHDTETGAESQLAEQRSMLAQLGAQTPEARAALGPSALEDTLQALLPLVRQARQRLDRERAERHRRASSAEQRLAERRAALGALASLIGQLPDEDGAGAQARQELARLNQLELLATRVRELESEWQRLAALGRRQQALRREIGALGHAQPPSAREFAGRAGAAAPRVRAAPARSRARRRARGGAGAGLRGAAGGAAGAARALPARGTLRLAAGPARGGAAAQRG
jgi:chromosome partition protein MukB